MVITSAISKEKKVTVPPCHLAITPAIIKKKKHMLCGVIPTATVKQKNGNNICQMIKYG